MPGSPRSSRGLALVTVLWVLVLLSLMAASFTAATRTDINLTRNLIENAQAQSLAEAGLARAILGLLADRYNIEFGDEEARSVIEPPGVGGALEAQPEVPVADADPDASAPLADFGAGGTWRADGTIYAWTYGGGAIRVAVQSEAGKIDLNAADDSLLRDLFLSASWTGPDGEPEGIDEVGAGALTDAIRDFADPDDLTRLNGAEDRDYTAAGLPWDAKDAPFEAVAELQQVLGMTALLYAAVAPALTVYSGAAGVDPSLAPRDVLLVLPGGAAEGVVDDYLTARAEAAPGAAPAFPGSEGGPASRARIYTIHAEAQLASGAVFVREAVVRLIGGHQPYRIEAWRQGTRRLFP